MRTSTFLFKTLFFLGILTVFQANTISAADFSVKFIRVTAEQIENQVLVKWATDSEFNNEFFTIQRSVDGASTWQDLGTVDSYGSVPGAGVYQYFDESPILGSIYYRLRQTDYDGTYTYSFLAEVNVSFFADEEEAELQLYPNPAETVLILESKTLTENAIVKMMDLSGKLISINLDIDENQIRIRPIHKISGLYFLMISDQNKSIVKKVKFE